DVRWGDANLAVVQLSHVRRRFLRQRLEPVPLGDEQQAKKAMGTEGKQKEKSRRNEEFEAAVRANRQLATELRSQGLNAGADRFAYRAQVLERQVLRRQGQLFVAFGSWLLDLISGYGYRPMRSLLTYLLVVLGFALTYYLLGNNVKPALDPLSAMVFS